jgi:hypothetical protein
LTLGTDYTWSALTGTGLTRTATLTPKANSNDALVLSIANNTFTDAAGNANADALDADNTLTLGVDTVRPTVSMVSASGTQTATAKAGDTVTLTLTFTEEVNGLTTGDIVVTGGTGTVSNLVQDAADPKKYTVDFRPAAGQAAGTAIQLAIGSNAVLDLRGNNNSDGADTNNRVTVTLSKLLGVGIGESVTVKKADGNSFAGTVLSDALAPKYVIGWVQGATNSPTAHTDFTAAASTVTA